MIALDAIELKKSIKEWLDQIGPENPIAANLAVSVMMTIEEAPTVEAEPVVHAHWIHCDGASCLYYCSACAEKILYNPKPSTYRIKKKPVGEFNARCRRCGAHMDEK